MQIQDLIQHIDSNALIEIVTGYTRLYYGRVNELSIEDWNFLRGVEFIALNCSIINTSETTQEALIQIIV